MASTLTTGSPAIAPGAQALERPVEQSRLLGEITGDLLRRAGVGPGMRVLDAGCGDGDVSFLAASLVGQHGWVTGVDRNPEALELAQGRAAIGRLANVRFRQLDLERDELPGTYDVVVARLLLLHVDDPQSALSRLARRVRAGGLLVVQELAVGLHLPDAFAAAGLPAPQLSVGAVGALPELVGAWTRLPG